MEIIPGKSAKNKAAWIILLAIVLGTFDTLGVRYKIARDRPSARHLQTETQLRSITQKPQGIAQDGGVRTTPRKDAIKRAHGRPQTRQVQVGKQIQGITQGPGSIAQVGGIGNVATVYNYGQTHLIISDQQQNLIYSILSSLTGISGEKVPIFVNGLTGEEMNFAQSLAVPLKKAGLDAFVRNGLMFSAAGIPAGISLEVPSDCAPGSKNYEIANGIAEALVKSGIAKGRIPAARNKDAKNVSIIISAP